MTTGFRIALIVKIDLDRYHYYKHNRYMYY